MIAFVQDVSPAVFPRNVSLHGGKALWFGVGEDNSRRTVVGAADGGRGENEFAESPDLQAWPVVPRRRSRSLSSLTTLSLVAPLAGGPVGALAAIVFGWVAQHEERMASTRRGRVLAFVGMALGFISTCVWAAVIAYAAVSLEKRLHSNEESYVVEEQAAAADDAVSTHTTTPKRSNTDALRPAPTATTAHREGLVVVVDVGTLVPSLSEELARERVEAARNGDVLVVMTSRTSCASCRSFSDSIRHPLMQTALAHVRVARVDVDAFEEDLSNMKIPHERLPGFFLLAPDLYPRDGIDIDEWGTDSVTNVAPVLGAFVRGKYAVRRREWQPVAENRLRL